MPTRNLIKTFLKNFKNPDDPLLLTARELAEYLADSIREYERQKSRKKPKQYPKSAVASLK